MTNNKPDEDDKTLSNFLNLGKLSPKLSQAWVAQVTGGDARAAELRKEPFVPRSTSGGTSDDR